MATTRRRVARQRRAAAHARHHCRTVPRPRSTFQTFTSAAQASAFFTQYYSPRAVAARNRQAALTAKRAANAARRARAMGFKPFPRSSLSNFFATSTNTVVCSPPAGPSRRASTSRKPLKAARAVSASRSSRARSASAPARAQAASRRRRRG